jgi:hypothetical protein
MRASVVITPHGQHRAVLCCGARRLYVQDIELLRNAITLRRRVHVHGKRNSDRQL